MAQGEASSRPGKVPKQRSLQAERMLAIAWGTQDPLENTQEQTAFSQIIFAPFSSMDVGFGGKIIVISLTHSGTFAFAFNTFQGTHPMFCSEYMAQGYKEVFPSRLFLFTR